MNDSEPHAITDDATEAATTKQSEKDEPTTTLNVLLCTDYLPPSDGGVEHVVDQLARRLADSGHTVAVFTLAAPDEQVELADHPGIRVFTARRRELTEYVGLQSAVSMDAMRAFKNVIENVEPDVVHAHNRFFFTSYLAATYARLFDYELVTTLHLGSTNHLDGIGGRMAGVFQSVLAKRLLRASDAVVCVSNAVATVAEDLGVPTSKTQVVHNAVDLDRFDTGPGSFDKTVLYVGRLVKNNGPQDLLQAAPRFLEDHPDAELHIVGSGPLEDELRQKADSLECSDAITIHGFVDDETLVEMYANADIFCRPSYSEGLPLTLLESMATYSVPVVTPVAGTREVVSDGRTGHFVDVGTPPELGATLRSLLASPDETSEVARAARAHVENELGWDQRAERLIEVYSNVTQH